MKFTALFATIAVIFVCLCDGANIRVERSDNGVYESLDLDERGFCKTARSWKNDCNTCWCPVGGAPACTLIGCISMRPANAVEEKLVPIISIPTASATASATDDANANIRVKRSDNDAKLDLDENGFCKTARSWSKDCNQCWCPEGGAPACTLMGCSVLIPDLVAHVHEQKLVPIILEPTATVDVKCVPGSQWTEDCNNCFCTDDGVSSCTKIGCVHVKLADEVKS